MHADFTSNTVFVVISAHALISAPPSLPMKKKIIKKKMFLHLTLGIGLTLTLTLWLDFKKF